MIGSVKKIWSMCIIASGIVSGNLYAQISDSAIYKTDEINVISKKIIISKYESPVKIQLLDKEMINNKNGNSLSDALQLGSGVFIKTYGGNGALSTISMNGLGAEHTLVLLNGFRLNSAQNNQVDLNTVSKDNIESIEIMNNGASSLYGSEALGGVINVITKNTGKGDMGFTVNGQIGSYDQRKIFLKADKRFRKFSISLDYTSEYSLNNYEYYFNNGLNTVLKERENSTFSLRNFSAGIDYALNNNSSVKYYTNYSDQSRENPGLETGNEPAYNLQTDKNWNNILSYSNVLSDKLTFKSEFNFQNFLSNYYGNDFIKSYYKNIFISGQSLISYYIKSAEITGGVEMDYATLNSNETEAGIYRIQPGIFAVSRIDLTNYLKIFPSLRYDYISDISKNVFSGNFGINVKPFSKTDLNIKASAGNNFAAPTFNELYWNDQGNKDLQPETSVNYETGIIYGFSLYSENSVEFTYSHINAENKIVWSPVSNGKWTPQNIGLSESNVFLFDLNSRKVISDKVSVIFGLSYSYTQALKTSSEYENDPTFGKQIFYVPEEMAKLNLSLNYINTGLNLFYTFTGSRYTNFENTESLSPVDLIEANVFQNFSFYNISTQIKFEVNNLLNTDYQMISGYPMPLRNYNVTLSLNY
ncbi:MAG TPA: TonB-dependent receptor [Ignavibacteria bacterium]|nr:TonB-dependent receptor [Ignavibacteria bacterium]